MATVTTGTLALAYDNHGPENGLPVLLIHGWPDDASTWDDVHPALTDAGFRVIVPTLRGFGQTRFLADTTPRTGNSAVHALDVMDLMDALGLDRFSVVGHDWGANIGEALAVGWPDRVARLALCSTPPRLGSMPTPPFWHAQRQWYHWFMATERGAEAVHADPIGFCHLHWVNWSPAGWFTEETFERVARAWNHPDFVAVTLHSYRARWGEAEPDVRSVTLENQVKATRVLSLPALYLHGAEDGVNPPETAARVRDHFVGPFTQRCLDGVGHFPQRERPQAVVDALLALLQESHAGE